MGRNSISGETTMTKMEPETTKLEQAQRWTKFACAVLKVMEEEQLPVPTLRAGVAFVREMVEDVSNILNRFTVGTVDGHDTVYYDDIPF